MVNEEILRGLLQRIIQLEREVSRLKQREAPAIRSISGGSYPSGEIGQVLIDFDGGHLRYWNGSSWVAFT